LGQFQRIIELFTKKIVKKLFKIWFWDPGSEIRDPQKPIPDPGSRGLVKKPRSDVPRASWIEGSSLTAKRSDVGGNRGRGGGGGYRGGGAGHFNNGGGRGFFPRGRGGRGRFFPPHGRY
jgi:hypothetical protein